MAAFFPSRPDLQALADRYRQGDMEALGPLWQGLLKRGMRFVRGRQVPRSEAHDLIQDKVEDLVARLNRGQHLTNVEAYLLKSLDNALKRRGRQQKEETSLPEEEEALRPDSRWLEEGDGSAETDWIRQESQQAKIQRLAQALSQLGERCQEVIRYFYWANCGMADLVEELSFGSTDSAKVRKNQCMSRLRQLFFVDRA
jgi:RNA polymerase sigma factor (sigma-70 family)